MNRTEKMPSIWAGLLALIVILFTVACQPTAQTEDAPVPPSAPGVSEIETAPETDRSQPPPATQVPAAADTTAPAETLPAPTSMVPQPSPPAGGKMPLLTDPSRMPPRDLIGPSPEAEKVIVLAQKDLAQRLGVAEEVILIHSIEPVTWPDASLGCPLPGMAYATVLTPGYRVLLESAGRVYEYHTAMSSTILVCEEPDTTGQVPDREPDGSVQDGWPNESRDPDLIVIPPPKRE